MKGLLFGYIIRVFIPTKTQWSLYHVSREQIVKIWILRAVQMSYIIGLQEQKNENNTFKSNVNAKE